MAKKMYRTASAKTSTAVVSFAQDMLKTRKNDRGVEKFGGTLIFPKAIMKEKIWLKEDGTKVSPEDMVRECIVGEWGEAGLTRAANGLIKSPFLDGAGKEARNKETGELHPGMGADVFFVRVSANVDRPPKVSSSPTSFVPATTEDVYSGCKGFAVINAFAWHNDQNGDGVSFGLDSFFKREDGDRLGGSGGSGNPDRWADTIADAGETPSSTKGGAGAGGLFGGTANFD